MPVPNNHGSGSVGTTSPTASQGNIAAQAVPAASIAPATGQHSSHPSASTVTPGIQAILEAEKEAAMLIEQARQCTHHSISFQ